MLPYLLNPTLPFDGKMAARTRKCSEVVLRLSPWVARFLTESEQVFPTVEARMRLVVTLARQNVEHKTGGPFGARIFEQESGRLVAVGVNQVESTNCSIAHAEMLAEMILRRRRINLFLRNRHDNALGLLSVSLLR